MRFVIRILPLVLCLVAAQGVRAEDDVPLPSSGAVAEFLSALRTDALAEGVSESIFRRAFDGFQPLPDVIRSDRYQPEFSQPLGAYVASAVSDVRVSRGREMLARHADIFAALEAQYGVERATLAAIWGLESNFGAFQGDTNTAWALATLALGERRAGFARTQLLALLRILTKTPSLPLITGSWAGAMGQVQFIPTSYEAYAVDWDKDGRADVWRNVGDALASAAHYLERSGWKRDARWGTEVILPKGFDYVLAERTLKKPRYFWGRLGVLGTDELPVEGMESVSLILPAGHEGPAFLVADNFHAILRYNNATAYGIAIGHLSDRLRGGGAIVGAWPGDDALSLAERKALQSGLRALGFNAGTPDGIIGAKTRDAIRAWQRARRRPADGHPTRALFERITKESKSSFP